MGGGGGCKLSVSIFFLLLLLFLGEREGEGMQRTGVAWVGRWRCVCMCVCVSVHACILPILLNAYLVARFSPSTLTLLSLAHTTPHHTTPHTHRCMISWLAWSYDHLALAGCSVIELCMILHIMLYI